jgi:hypothetical protein
VRVATRWWATVVVAALVAACGGGEGSASLDAQAPGSESNEATLVEGGSETDPGVASVSAPPTTALPVTTTSTPPPPTTSTTAATPSTTATTPSTTATTPSTTAATPSTSPPPPPPPTVPVRDLPAWTGHAEEISAELAARMTGVSWHDGCPVPISDLRLLRLDHVGFDGHRHRGQLVVHADAAAAVLGAFRRMYDARFPIERVTLVDEAGGSDDAAMAANLTTAFNCRSVTGGTGWSEHAMGRAIDINPVQNPYISSRGTVLPPAGAAHVDRSVPAIGLIVEGGPAVAAFDSVGWHWGGRWRTIKDYQHFSATGR